MPKEIPEPATSGYTTTTEVPLYWCSYGDKQAPSLLVLHGGPGAHHDYLLPQFLALAERHRLLFYDQRGGGRSRVASADASPTITWKTQVDDAAQIVRELSLSPLDIVGYSWGGLLALLYAIEAEKRGVLLAPRRLVLVDPAPIARKYRNQFEEEFRRRQASEAITRQRAELAESGLRERDPAAYRQRAFEISVAGYFADPRASAELTPFRVMERVQKSIWESLGDYDLVGDLERVRRIPTLVVHGWRDPIPVESSYRAARALGARFVVLETSGHVPYVEQPDTLFNSIEHFLAETDKKRGDP
ncbi:MAG: alpha/beta fold hydrolase [Gemmatimonadaceae bacterium]